jgi:hypothetical protein
LLKGRPFKNARWSFCLNVHIQARTRSAWGGLK